MDCEDCGASGATKEFGFARASHWQTPTDAELLDTIGIPTTIFDVFRRAHQHSLLDRSDIDWFEQMLDVDDQTSRIVYSMLT